MTTSPVWASADHGQSGSIMQDAGDPGPRNCSDAEAAWTAHLDSQLYPSRVIDRAVTPVWYVVGIIGNMLSAIVWLQRRMRRHNSSAVYLAALSINDTLFLLLHILLDLREAWDVRTLDYQVVCETYSLVYLVTQYLAPTLVLGFTVERFIAVCYPYQKIRFCTTRRAVKVVIGMIVGCSLLGSIQPYLWAYNQTTGICGLREHAEELWEVWSWTTEMLIFLLVPLIILIVNVLVMREVWKMSKSGLPGVPTAQATAGGAAKSVVVARSSSSVQGGGPTAKNAATNAMLLTVSFYVIFTTLPATLVYVLANAFSEDQPPFRGPCAGADTSTPAADGDFVDSKMSAWRHYVVYATVRNVVNEICLSHYACNFFFYVVTGREFRAALRRLCCRSVSELSRDAENGTAATQRGRTASERAPVGHEQRTLLASV